MESVALLSAADEEARALLAAAESDWTRPVPHCPDWDAASLVRHTGGIFEWMAAVVSSRVRVSRRILDPAPDNLADLPSWYVGALDRTVEILGSADPASESWTFSTTGDCRVGWWHRRLAVEVSIHRWDIEHAVARPGGPAPRGLGGGVAAAGIDEFLVEFLQGLLAQEDIEGLDGTLHIQATDAATEWWIDLDARGLTFSEPARADTEIRGTRSDLLLWLTNRRSPADLDVFGNRGIPDRWQQLRR
ncbi:MAG: maleylpyruvate isomerase N-terminal domain-containing protein [Acidimicrobiales bacterium]